MQEIRKKVPNTPSYTFFTYIREESENVDNKFIGGGVAIGIKVQF